MHSSGEWQCQRGYIREALRRQQSVSVKLEKEK